MYEVCKLSNKTGNIATDIAYCEFEFVRISACQQRLFSRNVFCYCVLKMNKGMLSRFASGFWTVKRTFLLNFNTPTVGIG